MINSNLNIVKMLGNSVRWAFNWKDWNPSEKEFTLASSCIQSEEKERLQKFVFRKDVRASLVGRLLMRKFVNEYADVPYNRIVFDRDENNRPVLRNSVSCINFNVSHQGDYTVLAGEVENIKLGVDLMKLEYTGSKPLSEYFRLMNRVFTVSEWREINGTMLTTDREKIAMFYRHWALKESYVKALGVGLAFELQSMDFKTHSKLVENSLVIDTELYIDSFKQNWLFEESLLDSEHCVAVALQKHDGIIPESKNTQFEKLNFTDLVEHAIPLLSEDSEYTKLYFAKYEEP